MQILGIGNNGHIGFNEPGSSRFSRTRLITLDNSTRIANSFEFANISQVPRLAVTMGIDTIMKARKIYLMAWGPMKAPVIHKAVEEHVTEQIPASLLQQHNDAVYVLDEAAASELTRFRSPWLTGDIDWTPKTIKKAVVSMALKLDKPVLALTNSDYNDSGLGDLLVEQGDAYEINLQVFYMLRDSIPAGRAANRIPLFQRILKDQSLIQKEASSSPRTPMMISLVWAEPLCACTTRAMKCMLPTKQAEILR